MNSDRTLNDAVYPVVVDKDVDVTMRDGARLKADVFRPYDDGKFPAILNLGPYQKDKLWTVPDNLAEPQNEWMNWETVRPMRAVVAGRSGRSLRRHRMGGGAALVQRQCRPSRHFLFRHQSVVRRQSAAA